MHSFIQAKTQLPTSWYCTMSVFCRTKCSNCKSTWYCTEIVLQSWTQQLQTFWHCTLIVLCIRYPYMDRFTQAKTTTANQLVLYHACFAVSGARTVKHTVLGWHCVAIRNPTAANCLTLYLACFAVRNSTANCSVMCLPWPWPYSKCIHCL